MTQEKAPGAILKLVFGSVSVFLTIPGIIMMFETFGHNFRYVSGSIIVFSWVFLIVSLTLGILARGGPSPKKIEEENPGKYTSGSLTLRKIGRILGIVGWPLSALCMISWVIYWIAYLIEYA